MSYWVKAIPNPRKPHLCADVHFTQPIEESPIDCECGWSGILSDFPGHAPSVRVDWGTNGVTFGLPVLRDGFLPNTRLIGALT